MMPTMATPARLSLKPALIMSLIFMWPVPNTMAFGGVATGIMKAQLAATAAGTAKRIGDTSWPTARAPTRGRKAAAVAVLLVTSVRNRRSEEHTSELQSRPHLVCRLLLEKKKKKNNDTQM